MMKYEKRWERKDKLGEGGQGNVYLAYDKKATQAGHIIARLKQFMKELQGVPQVEKVLENRGKELYSIIRDIIETENVAHRGALKILHAKDAEDVSEQARARMIGEMEVMAKVSHPAIVKILDSYPDEYVYISEYYPRGPLTKALDGYAGDLLKTLTHIRPIVEAVAELHRQSPPVVHRDIKPDNIFVAEDGRLALGDFGIAYYQDSQHTRVSETLENVGSRDWMPGWAMGRRVEEMSPAFDVFSLGKVIWSMLSGKEILQLWYFNKPEYDVEERFREAQFIELANPLFARCIVENEEDCLGYAGKLLEEIDLLIRRIHTGSAFIEGDRRCRTCGRGTYNLLVDRNSTGAQNFGVRAGGMRTFKIFACSNCGDVRLFYFEGDEDLPAWPSK